MNQPFIRDLSIDEDTGVLTLTKRASEFFSQSLKLIVETSDGVNTDTDEILITINTVCGADSTVLTPPSLAALRKSSVEDTQLVISNAEFESENTICQVTNYAISPDDGTFVLDQTNLPFFSVSLHDDNINLEDLYEYTITATADGNAEFGQASATADGTMEVYNACVNTLASGLNFNPVFYLPHPNLDAEAVEDTVVTADEIVYASSLLYVDAPVTGCTQTFDYVMADGEPRPAELNINPSDGSMTLQTSSDRLATYAITIEVTNEGGNAPNVDPITDIVISVVCGSESTTLFKPTMETLTKGNIRSDVLTASGAFTSANILCPVEEYSITSGDTLFDFTNNILTGGAGFDVTLNSDTASVVGTHEYTVRAVADGGKELTVDGSMIVNKICESTMDPDWALGDRLFESYLPMLGTATETFPDSATTYVSSPDTGCTQTFSYRMSNNGDTPSELTMNSLTGKFSLIKDSAVKARYEIEIIVDTTGGIEPHQLIIGNVEIRVVCGPQSTALTNPELSTPTRAPS